MPFRSLRLGLVWIHIVPDSIPAAFLLKLQFGTVKHHLWQYVYNAEDYPLNISTFQEASVLASAYCTNILSSALSQFFFSLKVGWLLCVEELKPV